MLLRTKFSKLKPVRYISHLELMDTFRRAFRRADFPVAYSQGYNPHIKLSLGQPLSVGMIGYGEFFDLELTTDIATDFFVKELNQFLPEGIEVDQAREIPESSKSLQAVVNTAVYLLRLEYSGEIDFKKLKNDFLNQSQIKIIRKRRKKKDRELDLKPMIYDLKLKKPDQWRFTVSTGSNGNVRPSELSRALRQKEERINKTPVINIIREGLFVRKKEKLYPPFAENVVEG